MKINLKKYITKLNELVYSDYIEKTIENDINVIDAGPNIEKILEIITNSVVERKIINEGSILISGHISIDIIYLAENEAIENIKNLEGKIPFEFQIDLKNAKPNMCLSTEVDTKSTTHVLINSRKVNIQTTVCLNIKLSNDSKLEIASNVEEKENIEVKCSKIIALTPINEIEKKIIISDQIEIPQNYPEIHEILKIDALIVTKEIFVENSKINIKGKALINLLMCTENLNNSLETFETKITFDKKYENNSFNKSTEPEATYVIKKITHNILENSEGDRKKIQFEMEIALYIKGCQICEIPIMEDVYSLSGELKTEKTKQKIEQLVEKQNCEITEKNTAKFTEEPENFIKIYKNRSIPYIKSIVIKEGKIYVSGIVQTVTKYLSKSEKSPIKIHKLDTKFEKILDSTLAKENMICDAKIELKDIGVNVNYNEINLKFTLSLSVYIITSEEIDIINSIDLNNDMAKITKNNQKNKIIIYFVKKGDTLWEISKKYRKTPEYIMSANKLENNKIKVGQQLII